MIFGEEGERGRAAADQLTLFLFGALYKHPQFLKGQVCSNVDEGVVQT